VCREAFLMKTLGGPSLACGKHRKGLLDRSKSVHVPYYCYQCYYNYGTKAYSQNDMIWRVSTAGSGSHSLLYCH